MTNPLSLINTAYTRFVLGSVANFGSGLEPPTKAFSEGSAEATGMTAANNMERFISNMIGAVTLVAGLLFIVYFFQAAIAWISSNGESSKVQKARDQITQAVIGLVVLVMAYALIGLVGRILGLNLLTPGQQILDLNPIKK